RHLRGKTPVDRRHGMSAPLIVAVPSKGRLQEQATAFFARAGLPIRQDRGVRDYAARLGDIRGAAVRFLSAADIAREIGLGSTHLAVTGIDLLHETLGSPAPSEPGPPGSTGPAHVVARLGFGHADVVVAVPAAWIDVSGMADL